VVVVFNGRCAGTDAAEPLMGLRVDGVVQVLDLDASGLQDLPSGMRRGAPWILGVLELSTLSGASVLVQVLDPMAITGLIGGPTAVAAAAAADAPAVQDSALPDPVVA
jgi:chemotaxis signal transduction protein